MVADSELKLTEERLARASVLQELTVSALDLFDPRRSMDDFLDRLAVRLGCVAALCLGDGEGPLKLMGAAGLSRSSRRLPLDARGAQEPAGLLLPYPELAREGLVRWNFRVTSAEAQGRVGCGLLLFFEGGPRLPVQYHGVVERLVEIVRTALLHRQLYARTLESERRLYEQKTLLESEREASFDGMLFVSVDGLVTCNRRFRELFALGGGPLERDRVFALLGDCILEPEDARHRFEKHMTSAETAHATELKLKDGRILDVTCTPVKSGEGFYYGRGWHLRDATERHHAEAERARLLAQEQAAREAAEDAQRRTAFLADASRLLAASLDWAATLERVAHLALPNFADWCVVDVVEEDRSLHRVAVAHVDPRLADLAQELRNRFPPSLNGPAGVPRVLRTGLSELHPEVTDELLQAISRDPEHEALLRRLGIQSLLIVPLTARGRRLGAISLVWGGSGRRYGERDRGLAEDLAIRAALAVDNARLYLRTQEAVRARDEFLSIASHELRTPITSLQLAAQGLLRLSRTDSLSKVPPEFLISSLETAVRQSGRMAQLIDRLLDVSRIQAGRLELQLEDVDLAAVVREMATQTAPEAARAGCLVTLKAEAPVVGRWDRPRLEQVVANLLSNAFKYGAGKPVQIEVVGAATFATLSVVDQGIGIPVERQGRIFERFERAVSARHYSGLGLGLYIVRRVLEALGGSIRVQSAPGAGSTFTVELPLAGPDVEDVAEMQRGEP